MRTRLLPRLLLLVPLILLAAIPTSSSTAEALDEGRLQLPAGFRAELFADDELAHNVYAMTIDSLGRVVVSGPGYVRILVDRDDDGRADEAIPYANGPRTGAQGLFFHGRDLLCTGDGGLIRYRDRNGDDRADGPPEMLRRMKTGGEHDVHSVQRGPDGWWYLVAGNYSGVGAAYVTEPTSPIAAPEAGTLLRLRPNLDGGEIVTDGFRNSYDFAFAPGGDVFVYDSDGERDVSLPWYRPTRVFQALPAAHAGWVSRSWKRPHDFVDMPPVTGAFGRGSPTGVVCYRHDRFPAEYHGAIFALDWTFGRILALPLKPDGSVLQSKTSVFATGAGTFGFAPTDAAVGPEGSLFVSVGGRGTRGGVYRITWVGQGGKTPRSPESEDAASGTDELTTVLTAPQPLSSWSRHRWRPLATKLGEPALLAAARDAERPAAERVRAIEILTDLFGGVRGDRLAAFADDRAPAVRARAVWSYGRVSRGKLSPDALLPFLTDLQASVQRAALEALLTAERETDLAAAIPAIPAVVDALHNDDRFVRATAARVVARFEAAFAKVAPDTPRGRLFLALGRTLRSKDVNPSALAVACEVLESKGTTDELKRDAARVAQLALGDVGNRGGSKRAAVFDGYTARADLAASEAELDPFRKRLSNLFPSGDARRDHELGRVLAMLGTADAELLDRVLAAITPESDPTDDVHHLIVAATNAAERTDAQITAIARGFAGLDPKIARLKRNQDSNWDDRLSELVAAHADLDEKRRLALAIVRAPGFGWPGQLPFLRGLQNEHRQEAIDAVGARIAAEEDYPWTGDVVRFLARSERPEHMGLVREKFDDFGLRDAVLEAMSKRGSKDDRSLFVQGLESPNLGTVGRCITALESFEASPPAEQVAFLLAIRRLGGDDRGFALRERLVWLLEKRAGREFGFTFGKAGHQPQWAALDRMAAWLRSAVPAEDARALNEEAEGDAALAARLAAVDPAAGDLEHGRRLYTKRACIQCHGGRRALGPSLAGVGKRFSRVDLFRAIAFPSRDVPARYQTTQVVTTDGKQLTGLIVYESVDGFLLRDGNNRTHRVEANEVELRRKSPTSLMPTGLLKGLDARDLASLEAYLKSL